MDSGSWNPYAPQIRDGYVTSCIITCEASREVFGIRVLSKVVPKECTRGLKGLTAGPLAELAPVRPIMNINRVDDRFIDAKEVLIRLGSESNLATMDWGDFEHLVRSCSRRSSPHRAGRSK